MPRILPTLLLRYNKFAALLMSPPLHSSRTVCMASSDFAPSSLNWKKALEESIGACSYTTGFHLAVSGGCWIACYLRGLDVPHIDSLSFPLSHSRSSHLDLLEHMQAAYSEEDKRDVCIWLLVIQTTLQHNKNPHLPTQHSILKFLNSTVRF